MKRLSLLFLLISSIFCRAQELWQLGRYDEPDGGLQGHATQILQDQSGMVWVATWNGLNRFDGYEFRQFKSQPGDGCSMATDRLRDIWLANNGDLFCKTDNGTYRFDIKTYQFRDLTTDEERQEAEQTFRKGSNRGRFNGNFIDFIDPQGLQWQLRDNALYCMSRIERPAQPLPTELPSMVRALARDAKGRIWLTTKQDATVRLLGPDGQPIGYLAASGRISPGYSQFGQPIYCVTQTRRGDIWLGSKPWGLFRLREVGEGVFQVKHVEGLTCPNVYDIAEDDLGRLWVATLGDGLSVVEQPESDAPVLTNHLAVLPQDIDLKARFVHITPQGVLLATTTSGLVTARIEKNIKNMRFHRHTREPNRPQSLSCNATMDIVQLASGQLFVSTETGGICEIVSDNLTADTLTFRHYGTEWGLPTDMTISMALADSRLLVTSTTQLLLIDTYRGTVESFGHLFFHHPYYFSEAQPLLLSDGRWLIGTLEGAFFLPQSLMHKSSYRPPLVLTGISIQNGTRDLAVDDLDTLRLSPRERSLTIHFAALDYTAPQAISYQFQLGEDSTQWNSIGHNHSVTLLDLKPGTYRLALRSTNADGQWTHNTRTLTIIAEPTFWETPWAVLLFVLIALASLAAIVYTYLYIKRIEQQRQDTLEKYLALLEEQSRREDSPKAGADLSPLEKDLSPQTPSFMQPLLAFVEANIGNSDADVGQMAEACAVSRSVLQRKMKQLMGVSPADFLREARMKRATQLLSQTDLTVSEVAYRCGFTDPKYFSRTFRQSQGVSPTEYKQQVGAG